jgi:uncharacterized protein YutE (UPF0331/DUF86 family)
MTRYNLALEEFENESDDGKHRLVYAYYGLAIYMSQCVEESLAIMLWTNRIFQKNVKKNAEVNEIIDVIENSKKTLGNFINEVKQVYELTEEHKANLTEVLELRNYIVHKYFKIEISKFFTEEGMKEMIKYFCDFIDYSKNIDEELKSYYKIYTNRMGLSDEKVNELMEQMKQEEITKTR